MVAISATTISSVNGRSDSEPVNRRSYQPPTDSKTRSTACAKRPLLLTSRRADIIGEMVRATRPDIATAPARVSANSRNREPVTPVVKPIGANTAASVIVMAMTALLISRMLWMAAASGR